MSRRSAVFLALVAVLVGLVAPAYAEAGNRFADWTPLVGTSTDYTTTMRLSPRFPAATVTSDSRSGQVGIQSGSSSWFGATTPVGQRYGSSRDKPYLNLRPKADNASSPSTTTYTFERATPLGWTFVLGDIDADQVKVTATLADGTSADAADLGYRSSFNLCGYSPRPSSCGTPTPTDAPIWDPTSTTLTGNAAAADTTGATAWFEPTAPLRTLTFEFTRRAGFPVFQTWFALRTQDVTGTINVEQGSVCDLSDVRVELLGLLGNVIDATTPDSSGAYSFAGLAASPGYRVGIRGLPDTCLVDGPSSKIFDLSEGDAVVPFDVREVAGASISGTVSATGDGPVEGVAVTLTPTGPGGTAVTTRTDVDGFYVFDGTVAGDYTLSIAPPDGYRRDSVDLAPTIPAGSEDAVTGQDFTLVANPTISGNVRSAGAAGEPIAGVTVELRDSGGAVVERAVTGSDGTYSFVRVPDSSTYTLAVPDPPSSYGVPGEQQVVVGTADSPRHDFALTRSGSIAGSVADPSGRPVAGVTVRLTGPDGFDVTRTTDAAGNYDASGLASGVYVITAIAPDGSAVDGSSRRTVTITASGESVGGISFRLAAIDAPTPSPAPSPAPTTSPAAGGSSGSGSSSGSGGGSSASNGVLPDTGGPSLLWGTSGFALVILGAVLIGLATIRRRT